MPLLQRDARFDENVDIKGNNELFPVRLDTISIISRAKQIRTRRAAGIISEIRSIPRPNKRIYRTCGAEVTRKS